jgi:enoyl-CoA hydratase/carnithine racemase
MTEAFVRFSAADGIAILTLDAPQRRNVLTSDHEFSAIEAACRRVSEDRSISVVILTGAGPAFCAGGNIRDMKDRLADPGRAPVDERYGYKEGFHRLPRALYDLEVPTIAAINGPAIGAGLDLACMCDIRIAAEDARFAESFVRLGIVPGDGGAWFLQRIVGQSKAAEMTFTGEEINAAEALACGLVSKVVALDRLMDEALALAGRIAANPGHALRMSKRLMREAVSGQLDTVLELSGAFQALAHYTDEHRVRIAAAVARLSSNPAGR